MDGWTLPELAERVADALAGDGVRAPNGRVRELPDARAIRWYATIGLVDRPLPVPGRSARYGPRHLLQLVAVKRRQAQGRSLAQIQAELTGATDETLHRIARVPGDLLGTDTPAPQPSAEPADPAVRGRFWTSAATPTQARSLVASSPIPGTAVEPEVAVRYQIDLPGGATLGLPRLPTPQDLAALAAAAGPLLATLAGRGLLDTTDPDELIRWTTQPRHEGDAR